MAKVNAKFKGKWQRSMQNGKALRKMLMAKAKNKSEGQR